MQQRPDSCNHVCKHNTRTFRAFRKCLAVGCIGMYFVVTNDDHTLPKLSVLEKFHLKDSFERVIVISTNIL